MENSDFLNYFVNFLPLQKKKKILGPHPLIRNPGSTPVYLFIIITQNLLFIMSYYFSSSFYIILYVCNY